MKQMNNQEPVSVTNSSTICSYGREEEKNTVSSSSAAEVWMVRAIPAVHPQNCCPPQCLQLYTVETKQSKAGVIRVCEVNAQQTEYGI